MAERTTSPVLAHWHQLYDSFHTSSQDFYTAVAQALERREVPDFATTRVEWREGGLLSARREYLRVTREDLLYDICAAPYGTGFFFSSWLTARKRSGGWLFLTILLVSLWLLWRTAIRTGLNNRMFRHEFELWAMSVGVVIAVLFGLLVAAEAGFPGLRYAFLAMPGVGWLYRWLIRGNTYFQTDTTLMFQSSVHGAVLEVIGSLQETQGLRALAPAEREATLSPRLARQAKA